jgi:hypothetical protein
LPPPYQPLRFEVGCTQVLVVGELENTSASLQVIPAYRLASERSKRMSEKKSDNRIFGQKLRFVLMKAKKDKEKPK